MEAELFFWLSVWFFLILIAFAIVVWRLIDARQKLFADDQKIEELEARLTKLERRIDSD